MTAPIQPGDLCIVVRDCCGSYIGAVIHVESCFTPITERVYCRHCQFVAHETVACDGHLYTLPVSWLKKIPPLSESEGADTREVVEA